LRVQHFLLRFTAVVVMIVVETALRARVLHVACCSVCLSVTTITVLN